MTSEIKPCPFCGRSAWDHAEVSGSHWIACTACFARGQEEESWKNAIAAWNAAPRNTPAERAVLDAAVVYAEAMDERWRGPDAEDLERKGKVRLALNVLLGGARILARERRGATNANP